MSLPDELTTEGVDHWYLVCAKDEAHANLCGPFFERSKCDDELRLVEEAVAQRNPSACDLKHFVIAGPAPLGPMVCKRPNVYDGDEAYRDWWDGWQYSVYGEYRRERDRYWMAEASA